MGVDKKTALVTGSSSGIGRAIARRLASDGYHVLAHYNSNQEGALQTKELIESEGGSSEILRFDIGSSKEVERELDAWFANNSDNQLDVCVNNAGITNDTLIGLMSDEAFEDVVKTNLMGTFYTLRWSVRRMIRQRSGVIVNMSSLSGQTGNAGQVNYAASKAGVIAMTKSLSQEVGSRGIRVNAVAPGLIETEMIDKVPNIEEFKKRIPLRRLGSVDDVAGAVSFLVSKDAAYITGHTISINGGLFPS